MKVKCPRCGFVDEGNFCSNCGAPLPKPEEPQAAQATQPQPETLPATPPSQQVAPSFTEKCPVCRSAPLSFVEKRSLFGLIKTPCFVCSECGAEFKILGDDKFELTTTKAKNSETWREYRGQALTAREWSNIANGGMSDAKQAEHDFYEWLEALRAGEIELPALGDAIGLPVILKRNEKAIVAFNGVRLLEPRSVRTGVYGGPSVRVAKGIYLHLGGYRSESHEELKEIDRGVLVITNKRIIFSGSKRTNTTYLNRLVSVQPFRDAIALRKERKQRTEYYTDLDFSGMLIEIKIADRHYQKRIDYVILSFLIEGLARRAS